MVQGKCIKLYPLKILTLFIVILLSNISQAISWLPNEGEYKFISSFLFIDEETEDAQDKRNEELSEITNEINYLLEQDQLTDYEKERLVALEDFYNNYDIFNDDSFLSNEIEYGCSSNQSIGLKIKFHSENDKYYKYGAKEEKQEYHSRRNITKEVGFYYKYLLYKNENWRILLTPECLYSTNKIHGKKLHSSLGSYVGYATTSKTGKRHFSEIGFIIGKTFNCSYKDTIIKKISCLQGGELIKNLILSNYVEYSFSDRGNRGYRNLIYEQISLAKEFVSKSGRHMFTTQIGYYWKQNLHNKTFQVSGPLLSLCITL
ncbi:MAG: hypothetical protein EBQ62_04425 [Alphaproteobacteria bacterium]|jgi:hypothetical protein|nr:hypothetical protein [Rickettsiales bacterium]NBY35522.1 hypothetical protein [Alphaproteobacteria bacterium]